MSLRPGGFNGSDRRQGWLATEFFSWLHILCKHCLPE